MSHSSLSRASLIALAGAVPLALPAVAQQPGATVLPPIIVQGATLERPPASAPRPSRSQGTADPAPASAPGLPGTVVDDGGVLAAGIPAREIGTAVTVVSRADLESRQVRHAADAFRGLPGVQVATTGSVGALTQVRIRGAEGKHTRVVIDGIEMNTTKDGEFDMSNLLVEDIERIEVIRGPMSGIYGAGALGGVINIVTRRPDGPLALTVRTEAGSFATREVSTRLAGGNERGYLAVTGQWRTVGGFNIAPIGTETDGTSIGSLAVRAGARISDSARIDMTFRHVEKAAQYDGFGDVTRPLLTADDAGSELRNRSVLGGVKLAWDWFGGALTHEIKLDRMQDDAFNVARPFFGFSAGTTTTSRDESGRTTAGYAVTWRPAVSAVFGKHSVTGLIEHVDETFRPFSTYGFFDGDGLLRRRGQVGAAVEWRGTFADRLSVTAGGRHDDNDTFRDFNTWRTSASLDLREIGLRPHASYGTGVKLPGMYDQFGANAKNYRSSPNLRPETSEGGDIGIEMRLGALALFDVTYFRSTLVDKIALDGTDPVTSQLFPINRSGTSTREGVETSLRLALGPAASLGLAYTYTDALQPDGTPEFRRAPHGGRADLRLISPDGKGTLSLSAAYNSRTPDVGFDAAFKRQTVFLDPYVLVTLAGSYKIQPNVELFGRIENLLDQKYQEVYGYNTAGVAAYAGVKVTFDDLLGVAPK